MKKILSLLMIMLILALTFTSCAFVKKTFYKYDVTFDLNGGVAGGGFVESVTVKHGKTVAMSTPTKENFTFKGWFDGDELYTAETPITKDVTLRAEWEFNYTYTLTFDTNGMADVPNAYPVIGELPQIPAAPQVEGYVFAGWYFDTEYTTRYFFDYPLSEATTLYAKFYNLSLGEYIVISNVDQLMAIKDDPTAKYLLACDINCKGETFAPIDEFSGEIEGNGYKIHNFSINETADAVGFIRANKGTVKNLSFDNFIFQVLTTSSTLKKQYGVVCARNDGTIKNCHILGGTYKVQESPNTYTTGWHAISVGGIAGWNYGYILDSISNVDINVHSNIVAKSTYSLCQFAQCIGGIAGANGKNSTINNSLNTGNINLVIATGGTRNYAREDFPRIGGIVADNSGEIDECQTFGNIDIHINNPDSVVGVITNVGQFSAYNTGKIENCYAKGDINLDGNMISLYAGGFIAQNTGTVYNCYTMSNINVLSKIITTNVHYTYSIGGFVAINQLESGYPSTINKCFAISNITLASAPTNSGYIVATDTGTVKDCYYSENSTINIKTVVDEVETFEPVTVTNTNGEAKAESDLLSVDFLENTLYFDRMVWFLVDGKLPELR